jgi:nicotinamidase-related amidase
MNPPDAAAERKRLDLVARLVVPEHTAVLTMELQNGVVGPDGVLPALRDVVTESSILDTAGRMCAVARATGVRVVHCTVEDRPDGAGFAENCKIFALVGKRRREGGAGPTDEGTPGARLVDQLDVQPADVIVPRLSGMTPFTPSNLDLILRNMGIRTVVLMGVSLNLGIFGAALTALDLGYQVVVVRDAVIGLPVEYGEMVLNNSISMIATIVTSAELTAAWDSRRT